MLCYSTCIFSWNMCLHLHHTLPRRWLTEQAIVTLSRSDYYGLEDARQREQSEWCAKTTNEEISNCSSQRTYLCELNIIRFICVLLLFRKCMCCGWCCQNWMSNYNNNNRIWANSREREREMNGPIMPFCCCCFSTSTSMKTNTLDVREYQLLNQFSSFVSMNDAFNITIVVVGEHCFLHNMLCTAWLLHLHNALTHT